MTNQREIHPALPPGAAQIIETLEAAGHEAFAVGGCVRDSLLGKEPHDWDITTSALPQEVKALFPVTIDTGIAHGTVTVLAGHGEKRAGYEVTTYRVDGAYEDGRHPSSVTFSGSLEEDLKRRDFTVNAMAWNPRTGLVDLFGGQQDLADGLIRCVGDSRARFSEDALRLMRAVRFSAQLGASLEEETEAAVRLLAKTLSCVSAERVRDELVKLLLSDHPDRLLALKELGLSAVFLPEWDLLFDTPQHSRHHDYDVGGHTLRVVAGVPAQKMLRLSALLHDIAKLDCRFTDEKGIDHFYGHPKAGAKKAGQILRRLRFDNATIRDVCCLVLHHDERPVTPKTVRRLLAAVGPERIGPLLALRKADVLAQSAFDREGKLSQIEACRRLAKEILAQNEALSVADLAVGGRDLIALGVPKGPEIGRILKKLLEEVLEHPEKNEKGTLLEIARRELAGDM